MLELAITRATVLLAECLPSSHPSTTKATAADHTSSLLRRELELAVSSRSRPGWTGKLAPGQLFCLGQCGLLVSLVSAHWE